MINILPTGSGRWPAFLPYLNPNHIARYTSHPICPHLQTHFMGFWLLQFFFAGIMDAARLWTQAHCKFSCLSYSLLDQPALTTCFLCTTFTAESSWGLTDIRVCASWTWVSMRYYLPSSTWPVLQFPARLMPRLNATLLNSWILPQSLAQASFFPLQKLILFSLLLHSHTCFTFLTHLVPITCWCLALNGWMIFPGLR